MLTLERSFQKRPRWPPITHSEALFLPVVLRVGLPCLLSVPSGVIDVSMRDLIVVRRPLVISGLVVFSRLPVVVGGVCVMF
jgi:hypothetical protein